MNYRNDRRWRGDRNKTTKVDLRRLIVWGSWGSSSIDAYLLHNQDFNLSCFAPIGSFRAGFGITNRTARELQAHPGTDPGLPRSGQGSERGLRPESHGQSSIQSRNQYRIGGRLSCYPAFYTLARQPCFKFRFSCRHGAMLKRCSLRGNGRLKVGCGIRVVGRLLLRSCQW